MYRNNVARLLVSLLAAVCLSACIIVNDPGPYWDQAEIDANMLGTWVEHGDDKTGVLVVTRDDEAGVLVTSDGPDDDSPLHTRTLEIAGHKFMFSREPGETEAFLYRYEIGGDVMKMIGPDPEKLSDFNSWNKNPDVYADKNVATVVKLNEETMQVLEKLAADASYWRTDTEYVRKDATPPVQEDDAPETE